MSKKEGLTFKLLKIYNNFKEKQIFNLDSKKENLQIKLKSEVDNFDKLLNMKEKLRQEEQKYNKIYNLLMEILKSRGILFNIHNNNFQVKEWDNLFIKDISSLYSFVNKNGDLLYTFEKKYNDAVDYIVNNYSYSVIVIRKDINLIKVQLRILERGVSI